MEATPRCHFTLLGLLLISFISQVSSITCPLNWFSHEQFCYYFSRTPLNWYDAETDCRTYGKTSHLASILSDRELRAVSSSLQIHYDEIYQIWIGLSSSSRGKYRLWRWADNSAVDYLPWADLQPSNCYKRQNCVELYGKDYMTWNDEDCEVKQPYLCKLALF
ncbi:C-type lectin lectoxin-Thr1-like [Anolis sagrei]|uniref:C-type lectin lectoxin-Thr1-like n=1 Tax=Anolis sagrei TaxID=38937 RepID=UPI003522C6FA